MSHQNSGPRGYVHKDFHNEAVEELRRKVAELKGGRTTALDMVRDRIDADPSTMTEAVDGLLKLYKMEFDERLKLQAQLDRANTSLKDWKQRAARMALKAKPLLDRATEPRADGESDLALMTELANTALEWQERAEKAERRLAKPRPMSEAPRDGTTFYKLEPTKWVNRGASYVGWQGDYDVHSPGWLPTSSGEEWPGHGERWSDEVALSDGEGE